MKFMILVLIFSVLSNIGDEQVPILNVEQERVHKEKFYSLFEAKATEIELENPTKKRKKTRTVTNLVEYQELIITIEEAMNKKTIESQKEYYLLNKYEILSVGDTKKIVQKRKDPNQSIRFLVPYEQIFDTIFRTHQQVGHKSRDIMFDECSKNHLNITIEMINSKFLTLFTCKIRIN